MPSLVTVSCENIRRSCQRLHRDLVTGVAGDCTRSGTTLCAAILTGRRLTVANVGDSGCLRISRAAGNSRGRTAADTGVGMSGNDADRSCWTRQENVGHEAVARELVVERISRDHKPECSDELARIEAAGGVVFPLSCATGGGGTSGSGNATATAAQPGPKYGELPGGRDGATKVRDFAAEISRVWKADGGGPGLAMSRSIGDKVCARVSVFEPRYLSLICIISITDLCWVGRTRGIRLSTVTMLHRVNLHDSADFVRLNSSGHRFVRLPSILLRCVLRRSHVLYIHVAALYILFSIGHHSTRQR